jgi:3-oxoisoapionate-4-phosphate decarboxylase
MSELSTTSMAALQSEIAPTPATVRATYRIETAGDVEALAAKLAGDQSTSAFTEVPGETADLKARCAARVVDVRPLPSVSTPSLPQEAGAQGPYKRAEAVIDFPMDLTGVDLAALSTIVLGGVFSIRGLSGVRVIDLELPASFIKAHPGPQFGVAGARAATGVYGRPLIGTIIKPNVGLSPQETAAVTRELVDAGVDFIKDDEKLMSPPYSLLEARVDAVMPVLRAHEQRTGRRVMYAFEISSADPEEMLRRHDYVADAGGTAVVVNIQAVGIGAFTYLRKHSRLALHAHRCGWDLLTRHPGFGMDFKVYQKLWRLAGVDQFQINGIGAKYWEPDESFVESFKAVSAPMAMATDCALPVVCSGQWGGQAPETYERTGRTLDLLYLCGSGIIGHPSGAAAGVRAVRQAWEAAVSGESLASYAAKHTELAQSLAKFGGRS